MGWRPTGRQHLVHRQLQRIHRKTEPLTARWSSTRCPPIRPRSPYPGDRPPGLIWFTVQRGISLAGWTLNGGSAAEALPHSQFSTIRNRPQFRKGSLSSANSARINWPASIPTRWRSPNTFSRRRAAPAPGRWAWRRDLLQRLQQRIPGSLEPNGGRLQEWPSPGGRESRPYGIAVTPDGMVWYSESGPKPNTIVRFDPRQAPSPPGPSPRGRRYSTHGRNPAGGPLHRCSGVNKVGIVRVLR